MMACKDPVVRLYSTFIFEKSLSTGFCATVSLQVCGTYSQSWPTPWMKPMSGYYKSNGISKVHHRLIECLEISSSLMNRRSCGTLSRKKEYHVKPVKDRCIYSGNEVFQVLMNASKYEFGEGWGV